MNGTRPRPSGRSPKRAERAGSRLHAFRVDGAERQPRLALQLASLGANVLKLAHARQRAHGHAFDLRLADRHLAQPRRDRRLRRVEVVGGHKSAADRGAFLPGLGRHLADYLLHEQLEFRRAGTSVGAEHGGVERVALGGEAHRLPRDLLAGEHGWPLRHEGGDAFAIVGARPQIAHGVALQVELLV